MPACSDAPAVPPSCPAAGCCVSIPENGILPMLKAWAEPYQIAQDRGRSLGSVGVPTSISHSPDKEEGLQEHLRQK